MRNNVSSLPQYLRRCQSLLPAALVTWTLLLGLTSSINGQTANGGFEAPFLGAGGSLYRPGAADWTFTGKAGITAAGNGWQIPSPPEGLQVAFLQCMDGQVNGAISQSIYLTPGHYYVSFHAALRERYNTAPLSLKVTIGGTEIDSFTFSTPSGFSSYNTPSFTVEAAGNYILQFTIQDTAIPGSDNSLFLDAIMIDRMSQLANGSFEAPYVGEAGAQFRPPEAEWTFSGRAGITRSGNGWQSPTPPNGGQLAFLQRIDGHPNGTMSQSIYLTPGTYSISFKAALRERYNTSPLSVDLLFDGVVLQTYTLSSPGSFAACTTLPFSVTEERAYSMQLSVTGTAAPGTDNSIFIDAVTIEGPGAGVYKLVARHSGQVLATLGGGTANQTPLVTQPYNGGSDKQWQIQSLGNGEYALAGIASGKNLNVLNSGTADAVPVHLYTWVNQPNFKFKLKSVGNGYYTLLFAHSGKAMTVQGSSLGFDAPIVQETYNAASEHAQWKLLPLSAGSGNGTPFSIVALPDTQEYVGSDGTATPQMFYDQINWINTQRTSRKIAYVTCLGDITNFGAMDDQWQIATTGYYALDNTLPYGIVPGNHDFDAVEHISMNKYNASFGIHRFLPKSHYGGHYGSNNESHYDYISAGGKNFIVVHMTWRDPHLIDPNIISWVNSVLQANQDRRAIIVTHELIANNGDWKEAGQQLYNAIKGNSNLFLMLCGHYTGEGMRRDTYNGNTVTTILSDYQDYEYGGNGRLREMQFIPNENLIVVRTYSPTTGLWYTQPSSQFTIPYDMSTQDPTNTRPQLDTRIPYFMIVNKGTGKALDLIGGDTSNGAVVNQWSYDYNSANQRFMFVPTELNNHFRIVNWVSGKEICPEGDMIGNGVQIHQWKYVDDRTAHQWDLVDAGNGWYKIRNVKSSKFMEVANSSTADNAKVQQNTDTGLDNQLWRFQPWGDYYVRTSAGGGAGKYLAVQNAGTINGSPVVQSVAQNAEWFKWRFESVGEGYLKVSSRNALTRAISVRAGSTSPGMMCHIWDYVGASEQKVSIIPLTNGRFAFTFSHDNLYWDIKYNSGSEGAQLQQYNGANNDAQKFILQRVP